MNYILAHKSIPVLKMRLDESIGTILELNDIYSPERVPIGIKYVNNKIDRQSLNAWWIGRSIPASRSGLREALNIMQITSPYMLLTKCFGLSLSDQYWVFPENSKLSWEEVNFFDNPFSDDVGNILFGDAPENNNEIDLVSPDNTSDGWLKKKWIIADGKRLLVKGGSAPAWQEPYNEVLASIIMRRLSIPNASYSLMTIDNYPYSVCEDFITRDTELITAWHIIQSENKPNHVSLYQHYLDCCSRFGMNDISDFLDKMLTLDFLIVNEDRHFKNFGIIRDANTLECIGAAPIFDCGTSLWYNRFTHMINPREKHESKPFRSDHSAQIGLVKSFNWIDFSSLKGIDEEFRDMLQGSSFIDSSRRDALCNGLKERIEILHDVVRNKSIKR